MNQIAGSNATVVFSPEFDTIVLSNRTFSTIASAIERSMTGVNCTNPSLVGGCIYNGPCGDISAKNTSITVTFGDSIKYLIPVSSLFVDDPAQNACRIKISRGTTPSFIFGMPWFNTYHTTFDLENKLLHFALGFDSVGKIY